MTVYSGFASRSSHLYTRRLTNTDIGYNIVY